MPIKTELQGVRHIDGDVRIRIDPDNKESIVVMGKFMIGDSGNITLTFPSLKIRNALVTELLKPTFRPPLIEIDVIENKEEK